MAWIFAPGALAFSPLDVLPNGLAEWLLAGLAVYGFPLLLAVSFAGSLGIPFPITLVIVAAGACTRQGMIDWRAAGLACLLGASLADQSEYWLGRIAGSRWLAWFARQPAWQQALDTFQRRGGWAILLTRFWLTPLAPAVNVIAGSRCSYPRFLLFDLTGQLLWVLVYGGLGYLFAAQWQLVARLLGNFTGLSLAAVLLAWGGYALLGRKIRASHQG